MVTSTPIQFLSSLTTAEKNALPAYTDVSMLFDSDLNRIEYSIDGGLSYSQVVNITDITGVTRQFISDVTGVNAQITTQLESSSLSGTDDLKTKNAMVVRTTDAINASFSESVTFEAFANGTKIEWLKLTGEGGLFADKLSVLTTRFDMPPVSSIIGTSVSPPRLEYINPFNGQDADNILTLDVSSKASNGDQKDFLATHVFIEDENTATFSTITRFSNYFNGIQGIYLEADGVEERIKILANLLVYTAAALGGERIEAEDFLIQKSTLKATNTISAVVANNPCLTFRGVADETIAVGSIVAVSKTTPFRFVNHPVGGDDMVSGVAVVGNTVGNPIDFCWAGVVQVQLADGEAVLTPGDLMVPSSAVGQEGKAEVDNSPGIKQSFAVALETAVAATPGNFVNVIMSSMTTS